MGLEPGTRGAVVAEVVPGGAAAAAGVRRGRRDPGGRPAAGRRPPTRRRRRWPRRGSGGHLVRLRGADGHPLTSPWAAADRGRPDRRGGAAGAPGARRRRAAAAEPRVAAPPSAAGGGRGAAGASPAASSRSASCTRRRATAKVRSTLARFTDEILPVVAPRASHLIVETWITRGNCGDAETRVTEDVARTTERPAETESEIMRLLTTGEGAGRRAARARRRLRRIQDARGGGRRRRLRPAADLTNQHLQPRDRAGPAAAARAGPAAGRRLRRRAAQRPVSGSGAGQVHVRAARSTRSRAALYREVDLYVPEMVDATPALKAEPWYGAWRRAGAGTSDVLIRARPALGGRRVQASRRHSGARCRYK